MRKVTLDELKTIAIEARGYIDTIYLHWSASRYSQFFDDYHVNIDGDGYVYISTEDFTERKSHTWKRNSRALGITIACAYNGTGIDNLGDYPPTEAQIESLAQVVAVLCKYLQLPIDTNHVITHAEAADLDGYGYSTTVERWDLLVIREGDDAWSGGEILRGKASFYLSQVP